MYICEWTILYEESLFYKFLLNNCMLPGPKIGNKTIIIIIDPEYSPTDLDYKLQVNLACMQVHIEQLLKDRTILSRSHTEMFIK